MDSTIKIIVSIVAFGIVFIIGYRIFQEDWVFDVLFPQSVVSAQVKENIKSARDAVYSVIDPIIGPVVRQGEALEKKVVGTIKDSVERLIDGAKKETFNSAKEAVNKQLAVIGDSIGVLDTGGIPENRVEYPRVMSVNAPIPIPVTQAAIEESGLPQELKKTQGKDGIFLVKDDAPSGAKESFTVLWKETKQTMTEVGSAIAKTFENIFVHNAEYRMSIPITKDGVMKKYSVYIVVED